jgi:HEAT repeat protein
MPAELSPRLRCIAEISDSSKSVNRAKLIHLSALNSEELEFLTEILTKTNLGRRQEIISQLVNLSEVDFKLDFSGVFVLFLRDPDETIRAQAVAGLDGEDNYLLVKPLVRALKEDPSAEVRAAAATALGKFALQGELGNLPNSYREKVFNSLLEALDNKNELIEVKRRALEAIAPFSSPRIKEFIEAAYHTDDIKLRAGAIYAMGRNCDLVWLPTLLAELNSDEAEIRYQVAVACGELGAEEAVPHLVEMIKNEDQQVQEAAIIALGEIGSAQAQQALDKLTKSAQPRIRAVAKSALKEIQHCEDPLSLQL